MSYPMKYMLKSLTPIWGLVAALLLFGCDSNDDNTGRFLGDEQDFGDGLVVSYVEADDGVPTAIGVMIDEQVLTSLPQHMHEVDLNITTTIAHTPYNHVSFGWNPHGHEPPGVYDIPHFDLHFYLMTEGERNAITPTDPEFAAKAAKIPEARYIPAGYIQTPGGVPRMGAHWVDPASPEFTGVGFSRTFIYGFWNGEMNFLEPMITKTFLESVKAMSGQSVTISIPQPQAFAKTGSYPTHYRIRYDADRKFYFISLEGLTRR